MGRLLTYCGMIGKWPEIDTVRATLGKFRKLDVIHRLAWMNGFACTWQSLEDNSRDRALREFVLPSWSRSFNKWESQYGEGFVFPRLTLLWLIRLAFKSCPSEGEPINTRASLEALGECCLMANDLTAFQSPRTLEGPLDIAVNLMPSMEYFSQAEFDLDISRTLHMLGELASRSPRPDLNQFPRVIEGLLGLPVLKYAELAIASAMKPLAESSDEPSQYILPALRPENFATTALSIEEAVRFLDSISGDDDAFSSRITEAELPLTDLTSFRNWPLLRSNGEYVPLDAGFILEKAGRSLIWAAIKSQQDPAERIRLMGLWGQLFEDYVNIRMLGISGETGSFQSSPRFVGGRAAFDGYFIEGSTLVVMEYKGGVLPNKAKFSNDAKQLEKVLEAKLIEGDTQGREGVRQLFDSIRDFSLGGEDLIGPDDDSTITATSVRKIIPVLLHLDNSLRAPFLNAHMARRFREMGRFKNITVTPPVLLSISAVEELEEYFKEDGMAKYLESFLAQLRSDPAAMLFPAALPILKGKPQRPGAAVRLFGEYMEGQIRRLFPATQ